MRCMITKWTRIQESIAVVWIQWDLFKSINSTWKLNLSVFVSVFMFFIQDTGKKTKKPSTYWNTLLNYQQKLTLYCTLYVVQYAVQKYKTLKGYLPPLAPQSVKRCSQTCPPGRVCTRPLIWGKTETSQEKAEKWLSDPTTPLQCSDRSRFLPFISDTAVTRTLFSYYATHNSTETESSKGFHSMCCHTAHCVLPYHMVKFETTALNLWPQTAPLANNWKNPFFQFPYFQAENKHESEI